MTDKNSWDIDDLVDKNAGKLYECLFCLGLPKNPKRCTQCDHLFCAECLQSYHNTEACPFQCPNPTYIPPSRLVKCAIQDIKIKCRGCNGIFTIEQIDKHTETCLKPKCASPECNVLEENMKQHFKVDDKKFCSVACKYTYLITKLLDKAGTPEGGIYTNVDPVKFATEAKKVVEHIVKDPEAVGAARAVVVQERPYVPPVQPQAYGMDRMRDIAPSPAIKSSWGPEIPILQPVAPVSNLDIFHWDPDYCAQNITLSDGNTACFLMEGGYCFRTVLGTTGFNHGIHYWEIHADPRTENELKIGVVSSKAFNLNTAFSDYENGWGYYGLGQLRHGNNSAGPKYGKTFKSSGYLGVCLDMIKGQLSFALNGEYLGVAFNDSALKKGPTYPAVSLLHKAGCKLVVGKPLPPYFPH